MEKTTGIILCGGKSSRMGADKGFCLLNGKPLIEYAVNLLESVCDKIIIGSTNEGYKQFGWPLVADELKGIGPIAGIYSCLKKSDTEDNVIISCDMPLATSSLIRFIIAHKADHDMVVPLFNNLPEPLCAYYRKDVFNVIQKLIEKGEYKLQYIMKGVKTRMIKVNAELDFFHPDLFLNINTESQLNRAEQLARKINLR